MNPAYTPPEISRQLKASKATVLVTHTSITEKVTATLALYPHIRAVVAIGEGDKGDGAIAWDDFLNLSSDPNPEQVMINYVRLTSIWTMMSRFFHSQAALLEC